MTGGAVEANVPRASRVGFAVSRTIDRAFCLERHELFLEWTDPAPANSRELHAAFRSFAAMRRPEQSPEPSRCDRRHPDGDSHLAGPTVVAFFVVERERACAKSHWPPQSVFEHWLEWLIRNARRADHADLPEPDGASDIAPVDRDEAAAVPAEVAERPPPTVAPLVERLVAALVIAPDGPPALVAG
jgi:hypothetical protein